MLKISIKRGGQVTNEAEFATQELLDAWLERHIGMGTFPSDVEREIVDTTGDLQLAELKRQYKKDVKKKLKSMDEAAWKGVNTVAELKQVVRDFLDILDD